MSVTVDAVDVRLSATGAETTLAQLVAVRTAMQAMQGQAATLKMDTSGIKTAASEVANLGTAHQGLGKNATTLKMDVSQVEAARTSVKNLDNDLLSLASTAGKVGPALAAAFAGGALTKFASDYQTLLVTTSNQTNMTTGDIATLDKTIRNLPSGSAPLASLASGFKNITDLGYSAADAQKIATEESKAATAAGADQATTMLAITSAMKEFNATANDVAKYSNIVTEAARLGNTTLNAWTEGTRTGVAVAAAYGVSLQEADAFMVALTRHGFDAAESATQLRGVIQHIVNESPNTVKEIANIKASTGIDLTPDFGPDAIKVRGFTQIMQDLQDVVAKTGDDSIVTKLIPALRGGQGALITVTQAAADSKDALLLLGQAATGAIDPVAQGFDRMQQIAGFQLGQTMKQLKFDLIDVGQAGLPAITALAEGFGKIPAPVIESAVRLGELALVVKSASAVGGLLTSTWEKMTAATTTATAANATEATTTTAATDGVATLTAALTANTEAVLANTAAKADQAVATEATIVTAETGTVAIEGETAATLAHATATETDTAATLANNSARAAKNLLAAAGPAIAIGEGINAYSGVVGDLKNGDFKQAFGDFIKKEPASPQGLISLASSIFGFSNPLNKLPFWQQSKTAAPDSGTDSGSGAPTDAGKDPFGLIANTQPSDAEIQAMTDHYDMLATKRDELLAKGAPEALVNHALYPEDFGESKAQLAQYTKDLALWQTQYAATQKAATAAQTELGKVDVSKGIASLASSAAGLEKVRAGLAAVGQSNDALNALTGIASRFDDIAKATDAASASYDSYTALLTNTNSYETKLTNYKKELDSAVTAATDAVANGTATPDQVALLKDAPNIYGNIAQSMAQLDAHKASDILGIAKDMPDWVKADSLTRNVATTLGGITAVDLTVTTEKDDATQALEDLVNNPHVVTITTQTVDGGAPLGSNLVDSGSTASAPTASAAVTNPVGWNQFQPLSMPQYQAIVANGSGGKASPFDDPTMYAAVMAAAQQYGVDPRALLAFTKAENNNATNIGPDLLAANNFGGVKFAGQPGATPGPPAPANEGPTPYAAFATPQDFFNALAANLSTGEYAADYQSGNLYGVAKRYVGSDSPGRVQDTAMYEAQYPAPAQGAPGGGAASADDPRYSQALSGGDNGAGQKIVDAAKSHLGELQQATGLAWDNWCEKFVGDVENQANIANIRPANPEDALAKARAGVAGAGTIIPFGQQRPGDQAIIVNENNPRDQGGHPYDASAIGHTGIVADDTSKFYNTSAKGIVLSDIPTGTVFIRPDGVVSGTPTEGATAVKADGGTANVLAKSGVGTVDYRQPLAKQPGDATTHIGPALVGSQVGVLSGLLQDLGGKGAAQLNTYFDQIYAAETKKLTSDTVGKGTNGALTTAQKTTIDNTALAQSLDLTNAVGRAMLDIDQHSANYATDLQRVRDLGGPIGDNLAQQVDLYRQIGEATAKITADQQALTDLATADTARKAKEAADDQALSRAKTLAGFASAENDAQIARYQQGIQAGWQQQQVLLTAKQTAEDRSYQDATTAEDRSHSLKMRNLDDQLKSMQKLQQTADSGNSATEVALSTAAAGPGDLATKMQSGELLAIQKDFDSRNRQTLTDQIAAIADAQVAENRLYEDDKYYRDQAHTTATRNFQDEATQAQNNHTKITDAWASEAFQRAEIARQQQEADARAQFALEDERAREDALYATTKTTLDAQLTGDQTHAKALADQATATSDALKTWGKIADLVGTAGNGLLSVLPALAALANSGGGLSAADMADIQAYINKKLAATMPAGNFGAARGAA